MPKEKTGRAKRKKAAAALARKAPSTLLNRTAQSAAAGLSLEERQQSGLVSLRDVFGVSEVGKKQDEEAQALGLAELDLESLPKREKRKAKSKLFKQKVTRDARVAQAEEAIPLELDLLAAGLGDVEAEIAEEDAASARTFHVAQNGAGKLTANVRHRSWRSAVEQVSAVVEHPVFRSDALAAIEGHVLATVSACPKPKPSSKKSAGAAPGSNNKWRGGRGGRMRGGGRGGGGRGGGGRGGKRDGSGGKRGGSGGRRRK